MKRIVILMLTLFITSQSRGQNTMNYQTNGLAGWIELGNLSLPQQGNNANIRIYGGSGYNATIYQQGNVEINIRTSNTASVDDNGYGFSATAISYCRSQFISQIKIVPNLSGANANEFRIFIYCGIYIGNSFYSVELSQGTWTPVNSATADPGEAYIVPFEYVVNNNTYLMGNVGIGTTTPTEKLSVNGNIRAKEIKVETANWPDYVFSDTYQPSSLNELETYIKTNKHLPEILSAKAMETNGINVGEMNAMLLKKIEELTLYVIGLKKENEKQQKEIDKLKD